MYFAVLYPISMVVKLFASQRSALLRECGEHRMVCSGSSPFWTATHDAIVQVLKGMLNSAGFVDVKEEDRWWGPDAPLGARKKRPDVTAIHPKTLIILTADFERALVFATPL